MKGIFLVEMARNACMTQTSDRLSPSLGVFPRKSKVSAAPAGLKPVVLWSQSEGEERAGAVCPATLEGRVGDKVCRHVLTSEL